MELFELIRPKKRNTTNEIKRQAIKLPPEVYDLIEDLAREHKVTKTGLIHLLFYKALAEFAGVENPEEKVKEWLIQAEV